MRRKKKGVLPAYLPTPGGRSYTVSRGDDARVNCERAEGPPAVRVTRSYKPDDDRVASSIVRALPNRCDI